MNLITENEINEIKTLTIKALEQISFYLGDNAFRLIDINEDGSLKRYPININIFETLMYGMTLLPYKDINIRDKVKESVDELKNNNKFRISLNNHRDSELKVTDRYDMITELVGEFND